QGYNVLRGVLMRRILIVAFLLAVSSLCFGQSTNSTKQPALYKAGQVWKLDDQLGFNDSTVTILKVESRPKVGIVIHVRIDKVPAGDCSSVHLTKSIEHLALTERTLRESARELLKENAELPDAYFEAYRLWEKEKKPEIVKPPLREVIASNPSLMICNL